MKAHGVLNRLGKCANVRYRKNQVLLWFTVNSQSKQKKFRGLFELEMVEMFTTALLLTNYYLNFKFFQALRSTLLKNEIKNILKKDGSHVKIAWQLIIARDRSKTFKKRERKTKNEKKSNKSFFTFTFLYRKIYILLENILRKT